MSYEAYTAAYGEDQQQRPKPYKPRYLGYCQGCGELVALDPDTDLCEDCSEPDFDEPYPEAT